MALIRERSAFLNPPIYCSACPGSGYLPTQGQLLQVEGNVAVSAVKTPEDGDGLVLHLVNEASDATVCRVTLCRSIASAVLTDANEKGMQTLDVVNGKEVALYIPAMSVQTLLLTF